MEKNVIRIAVAMVLAITIVSCDKEITKVDTVPVQQQNSGPSALDMTKVLWCWSAPECNLSVEKLMEINWELGGSSIYQILIPDSVAAGVIGEIRINSPYAEAITASLVMKDHATKMIDFECQTNAELFRWASEMMDRGYHVVCWRDQETGRYRARAYTQEEWDWYIGQNNNG